MKQCEDTKMVSESKVRVISVLGMLLPKADLIAVCVAMRSYTHPCVQTHIHYWHEGEKTKANLLHCGLLSGGGGKDHGELLSRWHLRALGVGALMCLNKKSGFHLAAEPRFKSQTPWRGSGVFPTPWVIPPVFCPFFLKKKSNLHLDHLQPKGMLMDFKHGWIRPCFALTRKAFWPGINGRWNSFGTIHSKIKLRHRLSCWPLDLWSWLYCHHLKKKRKSWLIYLNKRHFTHYILHPIRTGRQAKPLKSLLSNTTCPKGLTGVLSLQSAWPMISADARRREFLFSRFCLSLRSTGAQLSAAGSDPETSEERISITVSPSELEFFFFTGFYISINGFIHWLYHLKYALSYA